MRELPGDLFTEAFSNPILPQKLYHQANSTWLLPSCSGFHLLTLRFSFQGINLVTLFFGPYQFPPTEHSTVVPTLQIPETLTFTLYKFQVLLAAASFVKFLALARFTSP